MECQMKKSCPYYEEKCDQHQEESCAKYHAYIDVQNPTIVENTINELGLDINTETWELLMSMQKQFAARFHKVDDLTKQEKDYWIDRYLVCVEDEIREVREHLNIYPGQKNTKNITQDSELKKEIIDILHFVMDEFIVGGISHDQLKKHYLKKYSSNIKDVNDFLLFAYDNQKNTIHNEYFNFSKDSTVLLLTLRLLDCGGKVRQQISWKHWKKPSDEINEVELYSAFAETFKILVDMFCVLNINPNDIREIYIKKNVENILRQTHGYGGK